MVRIRKPNFNNDSDSENDNHNDTGKPKGNRKGKARPARKSASSSQGNAKRLAAGVEPPPKKKRNVRPGNCANCGCDETETDLWRTNHYPTTHNNGMVCNACGLWARDHGCARPKHMWKHVKARVQKREQIQAAKAAAAAEMTNGGMQSSAEGESPYQVTSPVPSSPWTESSSEYSDLATPSESPRLPVAPAPSPAGEYFNYDHKGPKADDLAAANTLLSMMTLNLHQGPPPLAPAPPSFTNPFGSPNFTQRSHTYDGDDNRAARAPRAGRRTSDADIPSCHLFQMAPHTLYIPSWMSNQRLPPVTPTTPNGAYYGRRHSYPTTPTQTTPTGPRHIVRPSLENIVQHDNYYDRRGSQPSPPSYSSSMYTSAPYIGNGAVHNNPLPNRRHY